MSPEEYRSERFFTNLQRRDRPDVTTELLATCEKSLEWIDNLIQAIGEQAVIDTMPNNWGGRIAIRNAINLAKSLPRHP